MNEITLTLDKEFLKELITETIKEKMGIELWCDGKIIACVSAYEEINPDLPQKIQYRIRALCVDENYRMQGIARKLFSKIIEEVIKQGAQAAWFTARCHLTKFYNSFGFQEYGDSFLIPNSCMHIKMYKILPTLFRIGPKIFAKKLAFVESSHKL